MELSLQPGLRGEKRMCVTSENTAAALGSGSLQVLATPAMIALIEGAALASVASGLPEGCTSVGTALNVRHLSATPVGCTVTAETELVAVERRRLVFSVRVTDEAGLVGEGEHERFVVEAARFMEKADAKREERA